MQAVTWPRALRVTAYARPWLAQTSLTGGASLSGVEQVVLSANARWMARLEVIVRDVASQRAFALLHARSSGGVTPVRVPVMCCTTQPGRALRTRFVDPPRTAFDDGAEFIEDEATILLESAAALRATTLRVSSASAMTLAPGDYLGLGDRLHQIVDMRATGAASIDVDIVPPLREAAPAGARLSTRLAVCAMRMTTPSEAFAQMLAVGRFATFTLDFAEVI